MRTVTRCGWGQFCFMVSSLGVFRDAIIICLAPSDKISWNRCSPIPELAPVINTVLSK